MRAALALASLLLLAGCFGGSNGGTSGDTSSTDPTPEPEDDNGVLYVTFEADAPSTLEVPFPTLDSCRSPQDWMAGDVTAANATAELRDAGDGRTGKIVAITGQGRVSWSSQIELGPPCQTFRYDPWSIDPDADDGAVEVRLASGSIPHASVLVRSVRETCGNATLYDGVPGAEWSAFAGNTIPVSCG
jgi:hypothetical protein